MRKNKYAKITAAIYSVVLFFGINIVPIASAQYSSPNYKVEEVQFGVGGELDSSSPNYRAQQSLGALTGGDTSSAAYDAYAGFLSQNAPFLEAAVMNASVNFGTLSDSSYSSGAAQGGSCSCSFYVRSYLSGSYVVVSASQPPTNENGDSLDAMSSPGAPSNNGSVEEFGINVVDNSTPNIGANPANQPDNTFADGKAATGYDTPDQFKYAPGDTIARSQATAGNPAIGETDYTISYVAKPSTITPAGFYQMNQMLIVVATF